MCVPMPLPRPCVALIAMLALAFSVHSAVVSAEPQQASEAKPDLNGVWQVLNRANFNVEPHGLQASMMMTEGPVNAVQPAVLTYTA